MAEIAEQATAPTGAIIDVTEAAAAKAREVLKDSPHTGIRIAVVGGGCAGLQYDIQPAEKAAGTRQSSLSRDLPRLPGVGVGALGLLESRQHSAW